MLVVHNTYRALLRHDGTHHLTPMLISQGCSRHQDPILCNSDFVRLSIAVLNALVKLSVTTWHVLLVLVAPRAMRVASWV